MQLTKKQLKESNIIDAAEEVIGSVGLKNAKMDDIAAAAGITKVTLYSYFQSKENLYLAITYTALQKLINEYYEAIDINRSRSGLDAVVALIETFMNFCEKNYLYTEALLEYFAMMRSTSQGEDTSRLTEAERESIYYKKLQDIHNLPFKLTAKEIQRGIDDGSIKPDADPMFHTLQGWTTIVGYAKVIAASGENHSPFLNVDLRSLKAYNIKLARFLLENNVLHFSGKV